MRTLIAYRNPPFQNSRSATEKAVPVRTQLMIKGVGGILTIRAFGKVVTQKPDKDVKMAVLLKAFDVASPIMMVLCGRS